MNAMQLDPQDAESSMRSSPFLPSWTFFSTVP